MNPEPSAATLLISGQGQTREVPLHAHAIVVGRGSDCDAVLDSPLVSRQHARIFLDPFGRWIVEDLASRNGVRIAGEPVQARAVLPGERIGIGPFILSLSQPFEREIEPDPETSSSTTTTLLTGSTELEVVRGGGADAQALTAERLRDLNRIADRLAELTNPAQLYPELCRYLADQPRTAALVVRLRIGSATGEPSPQVLACHVSGRGQPTCGTAFQAVNHGQDARATRAAHANLHLSRRVLQAIGATGEPVMASSRRGMAGALNLTVVGDDDPRLVFCAPVSEPGASVDALYLDLPAGRASEEMFDYVQAVARQARSARRNILHLEAKAERQVLDRQLAMAREIQAGLTPKELPHVPGVDIAAYYKPAMWVGGDYYDVWPLGDNRLAVALGDVAGKGLPAAMVMANLHAALRTATAFCPDLAQAVAHVNQHLGQHLPDAMFVTLFLGVLDVTEGRLEYVNAGHIQPLVFGAAGQVEPLGEPVNPVLGVLSEPFEAHVAHLSPGTGLLAVTDGVTEARSSSLEMFGVRRTEAVLREANPGSAQELVSRLVAAVERFRGPQAQQDDVTILAMVRQEG